MALPPIGNASFTKVLNEAIADMIEHGFDSTQRLAYWLRVLRETLTRSFVPRAKLENMMREALRAIWQKQVEQGQILNWHPGVERFTLANVKPKLRDELDKRISASADLIRLNRDEQIEATMRRFSGWASSIPAGGAAEPDKAGARETIKRGIAGLPFTERRVIIDQGHKLTSAINDIVANEAGAIAGMWHSHWRQPGYDYREDHKERDEKVYLVRDSWADDAGLVKPGPNGYTDAITQPGEEVFCRCFYEYIYALRDMPDDMITAKGKAKLIEVQTQLAGA